MEEWKTITNFPNYQVSNLGRVRRITGRVLKNRFNKFGYDRVRLYNKTSSKNHLVHRLVALEFILNRNNYPIVGHIDNNPANNKCENLEWCTQKQNLQHAVKTGGKKVGLWKGHYENKKGSHAIYGIHILNKTRIDFPSINEACRNGFNPNIRHVISGKHKQCGGYVWFKC